MASHLFTFRLVLIVSTAFGLLATAISALLMTMMGMRPWIWHTLSVNLCYWYGWALLTPVVLAVTTRERFERTHWRRPLVVHGVTSVVLSGAHVALMFADRWALYNWLPGNVELAELKLAVHPSLARAAFHDSLITADWDVLVYWALVGIYHAFAYHGELQQRQLRSVQLEAKLAEAQLQALQRQLHPHFLFNTLHAVSTLMHKDVGAADRMLTRLSDLLRLTLGKVDVQEFTLKRELDFLEKYVEIEQTRFRDRLRVELDVEPETLDVQVPYLILQPLVENAIRHGIAPLGRPGLVKVRAFREGATLSLEVTDNGPGLSDDALMAFKQGIGLQNTRTRLQHLYGAAHQFTFRHVRGAGLTVAVSIPWRVGQTADDTVVQTERGAA